MRLESSIWLLNSETPNIVTSDIREAYRKLIENRLDKLDLWFDKVAIKDPAKALSIIIDLSEFIIPKLSRAVIDTQTKEQTVDLSSLSTEELVKRVHAKRILEKKIGYLL